ncbi:cytochrome c oxidase assembly factor 6 homolog [Atheta coriaria]|uniref:cytochrome c oxidase assembly factor 6 homolog n=1 Tax=Dalotia coriaria TaxID=877792 RepID=UPI0031F3EAC0
MSFPTKEERALCWGARDKFWACLDQHKIENDTSKDSPCAQFRKMYEQSCSAQWVKHFDRRRSYLQFKEKVEKHGYEPLNEEKYK